MTSASSASERTSSPDHLSAHTSSANSKRPVSSASLHLVYPESAKRVKTSHPGSSSRSSTPQPATPSASASTGAARVQAEIYTRLQKHASPQLLLEWALAYLTAARTAESQLLPCSDSQNDKVGEIHNKLRYALVCLRAIVHSTQVQTHTQPETLFEARRLLIHLLITESDLRDVRVVAHTKNLLHQGLSDAAPTYDQRLWKHRLALQELQIQLWIKEGGASSERLAKSESKRIALDFDTATTDPQWAYHMLFLYHQLNTSSRTFSQLFQFAKGRQDQDVCDALTVMRMHWNLSQGHYADCTADMVVLSETDQTRFSLPLKAYAAILTVAYYSFLYDKEDCLDKVKAAVRHLHGLFDDQRADSSMPDDRSFLVPISRSSPIRLQGLPLPQIRALVYVLSAAFSNDPVGKSPRSLAFISAGLGHIADVRNKGWSVASTRGVRQTHEDRVWLDSLEAQALLLRAEVELCRSKFDDASESLQMCLRIVAHDHPSLWPEYRVPWTMLKGMLYHAVDQSEKALKCYSAVLRLDPGNALALLSVAMIRLARGEGLLVSGTPQRQPGEADVKPVSGGKDWARLSIEQLVSEARARCEGSGVPGLQLAGQLLSGITRSGIVKSKHSLSSALGLANNIGVAQVKPLALLLLYNLFTNTRRSDAKQMLDSAYKISRGLGGSKPSKKDEQPGSNEEMVGQANTGLWAGKELLKIYEAEGDIKRASAQRESIQAHEAVKRRIQERWASKA